MIQEPSDRPRDLLAQGSDEPPRRLDRRRAAAAVLAVLLVAGAVRAGVAVRDERLADERRRQVAAAADAPPRLSLRPDQEGTPRGGPRPTGVIVVVANDGPADVRLISGRLLPGRWQVAVAGSRLRPGRSVLVRLVPPTGCTSDLPRRLVLQVRLASGRTVPTTLDMVEAPLLYGGHLEDAVAAQSLICDPVAS